jgi:PEGA domain
MSPTSRRIRASLHVVLALALVAPSAAAQPPSHGASAASLSDSLHGAAKDAYESGRLLAANHDFAGALTKFQQAYDLSSDPRLLYNMAICNKELRHYARMQALLQKYAHDAGATLTSENRAALDQALAAIRPLVASVQLSVSEPGARVLVDGDSVGTTPLPQPLSLDLGKHTLAVTKDGFDSYEQPIDAPGGGSSTLAVTLVAHKHIGQLVVSSDEGATVIVDDKVAGKGHFEGQLAPGAHEIRVTESGKAPYTATVDLREGETRTLEVSLQSAEHHAPIWPWIVGGVVVAAGAAVGGYFLLKPSDTTGPAPEGALGHVSFDLSRSR